MILYHSWQVQTVQGGHNRPGRCTISECEHKTTPFIAYQEWQGENFHICRLFAFVSDVIKPEVNEHNEFCAYFGVIWNTLHA